MNEVWKPIPGASGYEASDQGRVRGPRLILKPCRHKSGYPVVTVAGRVMKVHRVIAETFLGPRPLDAQTCHANGDSWDNRLENLRYDTPRSNQLDKQLHGTDHQLNKTHCPQGHEYTQENTAWLNDGGKRAPYRKCRTCHRERARQRKARLRREAA